MKSIDTCAWRKWAIGALLAVASAAVALDKAPIEITADTAEHNEAEQRVTYMGNVVIVQGPLTIHCARLSLHQPEKGPQTITAEGAPVRFHQAAEEGRKEINGQADQAVYDLDKRLLTLSGNAEFDQAGDHIASDRIVYDLETSTVKAGGAAEGSDRVRTVIQPRQDTQK